MVELTVKVANFEGPLDLLLHLIKTMKIDIYDIPIAHITDQYLAYIHQMNVYELDVAGDYMVMAATLMSIKSQLLLPTQELAPTETFDPEEEGEDPRAALVAQLLEYRKYKYAATYLQEQETQQGRIFTREATDLEAYKSTDPPPLEDGKFTSMDLFFAYHAALLRVSKQIPQQTTIAQEQTTVEDKVLFLHQKLQKLTAQQPLIFSTLMEKNTKNEWITTFMAMLELAKSQAIYIQQKENFQAILLYNRLENQGEDEEE